MWWYLQLLLSLWIILLGFALIGRAVLQVLPFSLRPHAHYYFAPILGIALFFPLLALYGLSFPFHHYLSLLFFIVPLIISGLIVIRDKRVLLSRSTRRYILMLLLFSLLISSTEFIPILRFGAYPTYDDTYTYLTHSQWLQTHSFRERPELPLLSPTLFNVIIYQIPSMRMGASYFLAWIQSLFGLSWSYDIYPLVVVLALTTGSLAIAGGIALIRNRGRYLPLFVGALAGLGLNGFVFGACGGFMPQTFGLAFLLAETVLLGALVSHLLKVPEVRFWQPMVISLLFASTVLAYHEIAAVMLAGNFLYLLFLGLRRIVQWKVILKLILIVSIQVALLINREWSHVYESIMSIMVGKKLSFGFGWPLNWQVWEFLGLAFSMKAPESTAWLFDSQSINRFAIWFALAAVVAMMIFYRQDKRRLVLLSPHLGLLLILVLIFTKLRYFSSPDVDFSFIQFKAANWAGPSATLLFGAALILLSSRMTFPLAAFNRLRLAIPFLILSLLIGNSVLINYQSMSTLPKRSIIVKGDYDTPFHSLLPLRKQLEQIPKEQIIYLNLGESRFNSLSWIVSYLLFDRPVCPLLPENALKIKREKASLDPERLILSLDERKEQAQFALPKARLRLISPKDNLAILISKQPSYYGLEISEENRWRWLPDIRNYQKFQYHLLGDVKALKIHFRYKALKKETISLFMKSEDKLIRTLSIPVEPGERDYESLEIPLTKRELTLEFTSLVGFKPVVNLGETTFSIQNIEVKPIQALAKPAVLGEQASLGKQIINRTSVPATPHSRKREEARALPNNSSQNLVLIKSIWGIMSSKQKGIRSLGDKVVFQFKNRLPTQFNLVITTNTYPAQVGIPVKVIAGETERRFSLTEQPKTWVFHFVTAAPTNQLVFRLPKWKKRGQFLTGHYNKRVGFRFIAMEISTS